MCSSDLLWISRAFCKTLRLRFKDLDHTSSKEEPPDVQFRDAKFEVKEILDPKRPRHAEFKAALRTAQAATSPNQLMSNQPFAATMCPPAKIAVHVRQKLEELNTQYPPAVRARLDLLLYVNLASYFFKSGPMPSEQSFAAFGWRSVSAFENSASLVFFAAPSAPRFLRQRRGLYKVRYAI